MPKVCILNSTSNVVENCIEVDDLNNIPSWVCNENQVIASDHTGEMGDTWTGSSYDISHRIFVNATIEDEWELIRKNRDKYLTESDWTVLSDSPLTDAKKTEWATYRQALRDIPQTYASSIDTIVWPTKPS